MTNTDILSIQMYSLRKYGGLEKGLDLVASAGFKLVEPVMSHYDDAAATRALIDGRGLKAPSGHFSLEAVSERTDWVIEVANTIGIEQVIVPAVAPEIRAATTAAPWQEVADEMASAAPAIMAAGLTLAYHNHDWDVKPLDDGRTPLDILLAAPDVGWQADVAWIVRGGEDVAAWFEKYGSKLVSCHVKDMAAEGENLDEDGWCDAGDGTIDWVALWKLCRGTPAKWMVLEHDNPKHFEKFVERSFAFLNGLDA